MAASGGSKTSDNGLGWKLSLTPFVVQPSRAKYSLQSSSSSWSLSQQWKYSDIVYWNHCKK